MYKRQAVCRPVGVAAHGTGALPVVVSSSLGFSIRFLLLQSCLIPAFPWAEKLSVARRCKHLPAVRTRFGFNDLEMCIRDSILSVRTPISLQNFSVLLQNCGL